jgi:hypothetical protein
MECPSCGRSLANGARCVYCGQGTQFKKREELQIPEGTTKPAPTSSFPWGRVVVLVILAGAVAAAFLHPELNAKIRSLIP